MINDIMPPDKINNIYKENFYLNNINLTIPEGKTMVLLGPSGCGKTTILRLIAGLINPDTGQIKFDDVDMQKIKSADRKIGMVFQNYALYPNFSSRQNILSYFIFKKKTRELDIEADKKFKRTSELMGVEIEYLLDKKPNNLSGGEKQRVAIGRCITRDPSVILLDEPFSNLDLLLREKYRINLKKLLNQFNATTVYVTHDQQEALILSDLVAIMNCGEIIQTGTYEEIYNKPYNKFVAEFLNIENDVPSINFIDGNLMKLKNTTIGVRANEIKINSKQMPKSFRGLITNLKIIPIKNKIILNIKINNEDIIAITSKKPFKINQKVWIKFDRIHKFNNSTGIRLLK
jgi:ABC-type sugar transport system ATPase subunit